MPETTHRIYFDSNDGGNGRYPLCLRRALSDLAKIPGGPKEGMLVTIYMIGEIEMEATLERDSKRSVWFARVVPGTVRPNTESWEPDA